MTDPKFPPDNALKQPLPAQFLHDLRTPINQIIGYSEMLAEQAAEEGQAGFVPDLQKIHHAGRQLLALLDNGVPLLPENGVSSLPEGVFKDRRATPAATPNTVQTGGAIAQAASDSSQGLLLVVDDNEANRDVLSRRLERQGYGVVTAKNGPEALAVVRAQAFDLVLLDIMMPEIDGFEVLQRIKADEALRHIPVIMISALHEIESVVRCIEMGAEDYLCKPFDSTLLKARIGTSLDKKRARDREMHLFEQLQQNYKRLQELEKLRDDLTHMIIHDLRTPMSSVMVGMQALEMAGDLNELQRELMTIALSGGKTLLGMIGDLLDVEKMESGSMQLDLTVLHAAALVDSAIAQIAALVKGRELTLLRQITPDLPLFRGDENKLLRTLVNLLGNALKFTPAGGTVTLAASQSDDRQALVFSVIDTGEGIPPEAFERIFEKFGQVESRQSGRVMSTGLGLTFCKLAVETHGGHISVQSTFGQGSTFSFTIPIDRSA